MKRYIILAAGLAGFFLALFFAALALDIPWLADPLPALKKGGPWAAAAGVGLLIADVFLPVPSSVVMIAHGALFGIWIGSLLSLFGSLGAAWLGFFLGQRFGPWMEKRTGPGEKAKARRLLEKWGPLAVVATRPLPILAETVAIIAGTAGMGWRALTLSVLAGSLPSAFLCAAMGAWAGR